MKILNYRPCEHKTIRANFSVYIAKWKLTLNGLKLIESKNGLFIAPPSQSYEKNGETKYSPYFFLDKDMHKPFYDKMLEEVRKEVTAKHQEMHKQSNEGSNQAVLNETSDLPF